MAWTTLCNLDELTEGQARRIDADGFLLAVYLHQNQVYVLDSVCPHAGHDISAGPIENDCAVCPYHGWTFRLSDGQMPDSPGISTRTYPSRLYPRPAQPTLVQADLPLP
jgi:nitrite reductase/ring-hydroxylating ferredoxin subunit